MRKVIAARRRGPYEGTHERPGTPMNVNASKTEGEAATELGAEARWNERPLAELVEHLLATHHAFTRVALERGTALAGEVARVHGAAHPEVLPAIRTFEEIREELIPHLAREEVMLFPYVRVLDGTSAPRGPFPTVAMPVRMMDMQHEAVTALFETLHSQTGDYALPPDASDAWRALWASIRALEDDLRVHIHLESDVLFPRAIAAEAAARAAQGRAPAR